MAIILAKGRPAIQAGTFKLPEEYQWLEGYRKPIERAVTGIGVGVGRAPVFALGWDRCFGWSENVRNREARAALVL